jgi:hypothetical protein
MILPHFNLQAPQNRLFAPSPIYFGEKWVTPIVLNFEVAPTRDGSGQSSRGTTGAATPLSVTSTNSFEYVFLFNKLMIVYSGTSQRRRTIILPRESRVSSLLMTKFPTVATTPSLSSSLFHPLHQSLISLSSGTITGKSLSKTRSI